MKIFLTLGIIACFSIAALAQQNDNLHKPDEQIHSQSDSSSLFSEFERLAEVWKQAYNSKDAANLSPLYADDAQYISAHVDGYIADGHDAVLKNFQKGMDGGGYINSVEILSINSSGDIATVVSRYRGIAGGQAVDGRNLLVCKRIDGRWLIITHMTVVRD